MANLRLRGVGAVGVESSVSWGFRQPPLFRRAGVPVVTGVCVVVVAVLSAVVLVQSVLGWFGVGCPARPVRVLDASGMDDSPAVKPAGYRRSTGTPRGEARRRELLDRVTDDLSANGLVDFSLRRAARAADTTHKVLLYHFDSAEDLLAQSILTLRERRIENSLAAAAATSGTLAERVRSLWPALVGEESRVLDQAIGLMMYDPERHSELGRGASQQYLPALLSLCPTGWSQQRRLEVSELILAALRGFLIDRLTSGNTDGVDAGLAALSRALDREEAAGG